jgi:hypothetical protein
MKLDLTDDGKKVFYRLNDHTENCISSKEPIPIRKQISALFDAGTEKRTPFKAD